MLKNKLELKRDDSAKVLITWHKRDEATDEVIPVAIDYLDELESQMKEDIERLVMHPVYAIVDGVRKQVAPGTSAHFLALPKVLGRLGFRTRIF